MADVKLYRIIAIADAMFYGKSPEDAFHNLKNQAETMGDEEWKLITIIEVEKKNE